MSGRIFREIHERSKDAPKSKGVMWLRPGECSYWLMVYKPETGEWISLNRATWEDVLDKPEAIESEESLRAYIRANISEWMRENDIADYVAFRYGGDVRQITGLPADLKRGEETLPSVDAVLERIIAKVWFRPLEASLKGMSGNVYIGEAAGPYSLEYSVANLTPGDGSGAALSASDKTMALTPSGALTAGGGTATVQSFTPSARKDYAVTLEARCEDSDGNAGGQAVTRRCAVSAYWPCWAWVADAPQGADMRSGKAMVTGDVRFSYEPGKHYYHLLVPGEIATATQAMTGDWNGNLKKVECGFSLAGRQYVMYRSPSAIVLTADKASAVTVKLKTIN